MKRRSLPFAYLSQMGDVSVRWLRAYRGSGISCCLLILGACYFLYQNSGLPSLLHLSPVQPKAFDALLWTLGEVAVALLCAAICHFMLLALVASSARGQRFVKHVTACAAEIPSLCLLGLFCAFLSPFWAVAFVAAFSLIARSMRAILRAGVDIPAEFIKTVRALRLDNWQKFWRLHMPFAFPELVRAVLRDLPDFWLRIVGGECVIALFLPSSAHGLGAEFCSALQKGWHYEALICGALLVLVIGVVQHGMITPLLKHGRRYEVCALDPCERQQDEERLPVWWRDRHIVTGGVILLSVSAILTYSLWPWQLGILSGLGLLAYWVVALLLGGCFWAVAGGVALGFSQRSKLIMQHICFGISLCPVFLLFPHWLAHWKYVAILLPAGAILGSIGWNFLCQETESETEQFLLMGRQLHLPRVVMWRQVKLPLVLPALLKGLFISLPFFWDIVYLVELMRATKDRADAASSLLFFLQQHNYGVQLIYLCLFTLLAASLRLGICLPLQRRTARRYRVSS